MAYLPAFVNSVLPRCQQLIKHVSMSSFRDKTIVLVLAAICLSFQNVYFVCNHTTLSRVTFTTITTGTVMLVDLVDAHTA